MNTLTKVYLVLIALLLTACANTQLDNAKKSEITPDVRPAKYEPAGDQTLLFIGQDNEGVGGTVEFNDGYLDDDRLPKPAGITHYMGLQAGGYIPGLEDWTDWGAGPICLKCYLDSENIDWSNTVVHLSIWYASDGNQEYTTPIAEGKVDDQIVRLANFIKRYPDIAFFIRPGYEFDYQYKNNGIRPGTYRAAFRRIVDILREQGVENAAYVFSSAHVRGSVFLAKYSDWASYYPGNDYVDWLGYSVFDTHSVSAQDDAIKFAKAVNKPLMIAEATPRGNRLGSGDDNQVWDAYFTRLFQHTEKFPDLVKGIAYINTDWNSQSMWNDQGWGDTRIQNSDLILENWVNKLSKDQYLTSEDNIYDIIRFE